MNMIINIHHTNFLTTNAMMVASAVLLKVMQSADALALLPPKVHYCLLYLTMAQVILALFANAFTWATILRAFILECKLKSQ